MSEELVVQTNGPYLRVVPPDFEPDRAAVWSALDFELEEGSSARRWSLLAIQTTTALPAFLLSWSNWNDVVCKRLSSGRARRPSRRPEESDALP